MANTQAMATSFKKDLLNGIHAFGNSVVRTQTTPDKFKAAIYLASANIGPATTSYTAVGEATGTNYTAGGVEIATAIAPLSTGTTAFFTPSASIVFSNVTLTTSFDCVLIYNNTASGKNAVSSHMFSPQTITAGTLSLTMPVNDADNGLIRLA